MRAFRWLLSRPKNDWAWRENFASDRPPARVEGRDLIAMFVNHAIVFIQTEELNILTDPIWANRTSPIALIGPKRYRRPPILLEDLPPIDMILLSHNHYDHLDLWTLRMILKRHSPRIFCGLGNAEYLARHGVLGAADLDWWQSFELSDRVTVRSVPEQHFSGSAISDRDRTLWCGFVIETPHGNVYFSGDTGYGFFRRFCVNATTVSGSVLSRSVRTFRHSSCPTHTSLRSMAIGWRKNYGSRR